MRIAISGSTGFIGKRLTADFSLREWKVIPITRSDLSLSVEDLAKKLNGVDVVINLAGAPIAKRWNEKYKQVLISSRIDSTKKIVSAINSLVNKPKLFISTSAIGIYDSTSTHTEQSLNYSGNFLSDLCIKWEQEAKKADIRTIIFRLSVVLDKNEGAFPKMFLPFKLGVGGKIGSGKQAFSWIYIEDVLNAFVFAIETENISGIFNLTSPNPITNIELTKAIGKATSKATYTKKIQIQ